MSVESITLWNKCLQIIASQINPQSFRTWFEQSREIQSDKNSLLIGVKNQFAAEWLADNYTETILNAVNSLVDEDITIALSYPKNGDNCFISLTEKCVSTNSSKCKSVYLNPRYTFENYVVGAFNELVYTVAMAVAESPGKTKYNPLYVHGGVGLGKTHLLQAIGHFIRQNYPEKKIIYVTSQRFTDRYIDSLINKTTSKFRKYFRSADILLVDDVQFFSGKEGIQKEFFHIFNSLHQRGQQIVLTSDVHPSQIKGLAERLLSRFQWGLTDELKAPDFEGRMAILRIKAEAGGLEMPEEVLSFIAKYVTSNIRELEGTLIKLLAYASIHGKEINEELAMDVIGRNALTRFRETRIITLEDILNTVAQHLGLPADSIRGKRRTKRVALARQIAMYLSRKLTGSSLKHIGHFYGGRDHSTVIHACKIIPEKDGEIERIIMQIMNNLQQG